MACGSFADFNIRTFLNNVGASKLPLKILGEHNRPRQDVRSHPGSARSVRISIKGLNSGDSFTHIAYVRSDSIFRFRNFDSSVVTNSGFIHRECGGPYLFHHLRA